jgi:hypothetical protein
VTPTWPRIAHPFAAGDVVANHSTRLDRKPLTTLSDRHRGHQFGEPDKIEHPPKIIGQRSQAELAANLLQTFASKTHPGSSIA